MRPAKRFGILATTFLLALGASALPAQAKSSGAIGKGGLCVLETASKKPSEGAAEQRRGDRPGKPGRPSRPQKPVRPDKPVGELTSEQKRAINAIIRQFREECRVVENDLRTAQKELRENAREALITYRETVRELKAAIAAAEESGEDTAELKAKLRVAVRELKAAQEKSAEDVRTKTADLRSEAGDRVAALRAEMESSIKAVQSNEAGGGPAAEEDGDDTPMPTPDPEVTP